MITEPLPRHRVSELNRGGARIFDTAAEGGVLLDSTGSRPELVMVPADEWYRLRSLNEAAWIVAGAVADGEALLRGEKVEPRLAWLRVLPREDLRDFLDDLAAAADLARDLENPEPVRQTLHRWRSTVEYMLAGEPASKPIDWGEVVALPRPEGDAAAD